MAKATNRGVAPIGVYTLVGDSAVAETLATGATSAAAVTAFYFPEARHAVITGTLPGTQNFPRVYGPGKVLVTELVASPTADFQFDSWREQLVGVNSATPATF